MTDAKAKQKRSKIILINYFQEITQHNKMANPRFKMEFIPPIHKLKIN